VFAPFGQSGKIKTSERIQSALATKKILKTAPFRA
jgi:hypothetical protein